MDEETIYILVYDDRDILFCIPKDKSEHWTEEGQDAEDTPDYATQWDFDQEFKLVNPNHN